MRLSSLIVALALSTGIATVRPAEAITYDAAADFEAGWLAGTNPNGVWSYGYSSTLGGTVTLYSSRIPGADSPNQQMWISPAVNCCVASPSVGFNNGPAFDDGNVAQAANQILLVSSVNQNLVTNLVFTAPASGIYSLNSTFYGDQRGIGVGVDVLMNGSSLFNSTVTSFGQQTPFNTDLSLAAGDTVTFAVSQGNGTQNTGLDAALTAAVPEPSVWTMMILGFAGIGAMTYRRRKTSAVARCNLPKQLRQPQFSLQPRSPHNPQRLVCGRNQ
jgi:hypothetical protein